MEDQAITATEHNDSFDFVRTLSLLAVILFHAAGAYGAMGAAYWPVHDTLNFSGSAIRELCDVFIMPFFFFIAGYFALRSIRNKTLAGFFITKFRRLYIYWIFVVLFFLPVGGYFILQYDHGHTSYLTYWLNFLLLIKKISIGPLLSGKFSHTHFWFISLLFYCLILFGIFYKSGERFFFKKNRSAAEDYKSITILNLALLGILTAAAYFIFAVLFPGSGWVVIPMVLQFKITHLPVLILFFGFGVYSSYRGWFLKDDSPFNITIWTCLSILFTILFFTAGWDYFNQADVSNTLPPLYLIIFSVIRSFLIVCYLMLTMVLAVKYFSAGNNLIRRVSDVSYEMYLVHLYLITAFQSLFLHFTTIPVPVKIAAVFILGAITTYFAGKYTLYKFPKTCAGVLILGFAVMVILYR